MLTSCQYCGRIHEKKYICDKKRKAQEERWKKKRETKAFRFRKSYEWTQKSREIRERDHYMCLCCQAGLEKTYKKFNTECILSGRFFYDENLMLEINFQNARCTEDTNRNKYVNKKKSVEKVDQVVGNINSTYLIEQELLYEADDFLIQT